MMRCLILFCLFTSIYGTALAQTEEDSLNTDSTYWSPHREYKTKYISILAGYNFWRYHYAELGIAMNTEGMVGHGPFATAAFLSCEARVDQQPMIGPKIGVWASDGIVIGLNMIYYTNFEQASLRFRPEFGMGMGPLKIVYGYNLALTNKHFEGINKHIISLAFLIKVKKGKTVSW